MPPVPVARRWGAHDAHAPPGRPPRPDRGAARRPVLTGCGARLIDGNGSPARARRGRRARGHPDRGRRRRRDRPDRPQRAADLNLLDRAVLRRLPGLHPAAGGYYQRRPERPRPRGVPQRAIGCGEPPEGGEQRLLLRPVRLPQLRLHQYDRAFLDELASSAELRPVHPRPGDGPRVRPRGPGPGRLPAGLDRDRDPGRLLRRRVDPLGRRRQGAAQHDPGRPSSTTCCAATCCCATRSAPARREPGARLLLRPGVGVPGGLRRRPDACRDDFGRDRPFTQREFDRRATSPPAATRPTTDRRRHRRPTPAASSGAGLRRARQELQPADARAVRRAAAPDCARDSPTPTWCTAPTTTPWASTRPTWPSRCTTTSATTRS